MVARERKRGHILPDRQAGGPDNPLGARAMYLYKPNAARYGLSVSMATNQPWSIGLNLSSGCIRMMNKERGTPLQPGTGRLRVIVIGPGNKQGDVVLEDRGTDFLRTLFGG